MGSRELSAGAGSTAGVSALPPQLSNTAVCAVSQLLTAGVVAPNCRIRTRSVSSAVAKASSLQFLKRDMSFVPRSVVNPP